MKRLLILTILLLLGSLTAGATTYYVSSSDGSDSDSGLTEALAWASLSKVNSTTFSAGDSILFKRGDTFRGAWNQTDVGTNSAWIYYGAYGTGNKPLMLGSKDLSATGDWEVHSGNVWKTTATLGTSQNDISNLIFNNEASCGYKKKSIDSINAQGKFFYNTTDDLIYLYSASNPGTYYTHIEAAGNYDVAQGLLRWVNSSYVKVADLDVRYSSGAGIEYEAGNCFTVERCNLSYCGGEWLFGTGDDLRRIGNALSFVQNNDSIIARYCTISQAFDAGLSPQAWETSSMTNMWFYGNIITNCWYSYEFWCSSGYTLTNVHFYNNTCYNAGTCWSNSINQRPDIISGCHVMNWTMAGTASNVTVRNNIFANATNFAMRLDDNLAKMTVDYNLFDCDTVGYTNETTKYTTLASWTAAVSLDAHSVSGDPLFTSSSNLRLLAGSPAVDAGTNTGYTLDFDGHVVGSSPDIGAFERGARYLMNNGKLEMNNGKLVIITR